MRAGKMKNRAPEGDSGARFRLRCGGRGVVREQRGREQLHGREQLRGNCFAAIRRWRFAAQCTFAGCGSALQRSRRLCAYPNYARREQLRGAVGAYAHTRIMRAVGALSRRSLLLLYRGEIVDDALNRRGREGFIMRFGLDKLKLGDVRDEAVLGQNRRAGRDARYLIWIEHRAAVDGEVALCLSRDAVGERL